jgi:D-3-phosphoglycerate dehydrogenase/microcystin synthetase protein McyI
MSGGIEGHVVLLGRMYHAEGEQLLAREARLEILEQPTLEQTAAALRGAAGAFVRYPNRLPAGALEGAARLRVISTSGRGTDAVDVAAATARGIAVVNNPAFGTVPVAEHTVGVMIALAKNLLPLDRQTHAGGGWPAQQRYARGELRGKTLGLIGLGNIGEEVARICAQGLRMRVLAYDPYVPASKAERAGAQLTADLGRIWHESDFVSLHAELNAETRGMVGEAELAAMRPHAFLVNTARGPMVKTVALARALREGRIAGAALDTYETEPLAAGHPFEGLENVILTPHTAGLSREALHGMALSAARQILQALRGERPPHLVNPQVWR